MKAAVVGAGPVGCLAALNFAKEGWDVELYEGRPDIRIPCPEASGVQRSVNLVLSSRAIAAINSVDPAITHRLLSTAIPLKGRMIHGAEGSQSSYLYDDKDGQCIYSANRPLLNQAFLDEVFGAIVKGASIRVHFEHKLLRANFDAKLLTFATGTGNVDVSFDLCVGADGSHSTVRHQIMRVVKWVVFDCILIQFLPSISLSMEYEQKFIPTQYIELHMPARSTLDGQPAFVLDSNHLHVWPRHSFMLVAFPNRTFTCSIFAPEVELSKLKDRKYSLEFFRTHFAEVLPLIGEEHLLDALERNPRNSLITIKAKPYHYKGSVVLVGDSAHSMVPFIGQGLNCGLEDVRVLSTFFRARGIDPKEPFSPIDLETALKEYTDIRYADAVAICDLAMQNYEEMRHSVTTRSYVIRKIIDAALTSNVPFSKIAAELLNSKRPFPNTTQGWIPLYTMIAFRADIPYSVAKAKAQRQTRIIDIIAQAALGVGFFSIGFGGYLVSSWIPRLIG
ncbi:FAD/NAD-P-binding domain-containing protein [Rickenella mellea]|uniref:Kynurenine 3-monooxygenase n=1 Tax=Rickenella mellea TaxID=50990 RepID=A0A4Y7PIW0_9AGAM|nr:FAD/NAD-P-binding domain-containing protein [Rickenella mellea]